MHYGWERESERLHDGNHHRNGRMFGFACIRDGLMGKSKEIKFNLVMVCAVMFLYCANRFILMGLIPIDFLRFHFNDLCAGVLFPPYMNFVLMFAKSKKRINNVKYILILECVCGIFWEGIVPLYNANSTRDILDCLCYLIGGFIYLFFRKLILNKRL